MGEIDHVLFQDESMIRDYQAIQKTWFLKGKQRKIPTHGKHRGAKLIGCLNYETGEILCQELLHSRSFCCMSLITIQKEKS